MPEATSSPAKRISDLQLLGAIPVAMALHNLEEALGVHRLAARATLPDAWRQLWSPGSGTLRLFYGALAALTLAVFVVSVFGHLANPRGRGARILIVVQLLMLINAIWHCTAAVVLRGYAPGVVTALLLQAPLAWAVLRRSWREEWLPHRATIAAGLILAALHSIPAAILFARLRHAG
jgi:hypothetical protein